MANETNNQQVHYEDLVGVRSRISWAALLGGAFIAVACAMVLTFFFAAIGISLGAADVQGDTIEIGAIIAAVVTIVVSLFVGGWVTTQLTAGETRREAVIYGVLTWAVVTAFSLWMVGMGVRAGYFALFGGTLVAQNAPAVQQQSWEQLAAQAGVPPQEIQEAKAAMDPNRAAAVDPATRERAENAAVATSWGALVAMLLSIGAAIGGAIAGCGPTFRLFPMTQARQEIIVAR